MQTWFANLVEAFTELTWSSVLPYAILVLAAAALIILVAKKAGKPAIITAAAVMVAALAAVVAMNFPTAANGMLELDGVDMHWFYSPVFWIAILCLVGLLVLVMLIRRQQWTTRMLVTGALCVALSFVLSCIALYRLPQGGTITAASMLPIMLFSWMYGPIAGVCAGLVHGILQLVQGVYVIHPIQLLVDYIFPFAALGLAGLFRQEKNLWLGVLTAGVARFISHFISGYVFFASYAPVEQGPFLYSLVYNGSYMLPEIIICLAIVLIPQVRRALLRLRDGSVKN